MKRLIYSVFALAAMALTFPSCNNDDATEEVQVTFTASLAQNAGSRALSDGSKINKVKCEVYEGNIKRTEDIVVFSNQSATYTPTLLKGRTYTAYFFAYTDGSYNVDNLQAVTRNKNVCNDEAMDAFSGSIEMTTDDVSANKTITLTRPLGQLRIGTILKDVEDAVKLLGGKTLNQSKIVISNVYTQYNVLTGIASSTGKKTFEMAKLLYDENQQLETFGVTGKTETYTLLGMTYLFADDSNETSTCNFTVYAGEGESLEGVHGKTGENDNCLQYTNVPIKRNTRTNIIGQLLTGNVPYEIKLSTGFTGAEQNSGSDDYFPASNE